VSFLPKASPPRVGVEVKHLSLLLPSFAKMLALDIAAHPVMVIPLAIVRSITTPGCAVILHTCLHGLGHYPL
jgi:hypothetical protein